MTSPSLTACRHAAARPGAGRVTGCGGVRATPLRSRPRNTFAPSVQSSWSPSRAITSCALKPPPSYGGKAAKEKKVNPSDLFTFSYRFNTDIPMGETPGASIDEYLMNRPRIVGAVFPDKRKRTKLNDVSDLYHFLAKLSSLKLHGNSDGLLGVEF
uniref:Uncharacterized protein n=1 Tax=Aegilops tauschii subsp. strangulata TaxID=200361 RepID=A0A453IVG3_AEGTS